MNQLPFLKKYIIYMPYFPWSSFSVIDKILDMVYELNGRKNICIFENVITLQIIIRNEIHGNNDLLKLTST